MGASELDRAATREQRVQSCDRVASLFASATSAPLLSVSYTFFCFRPLKPPAGSSPSEAVASTRMAPKISPSRRRSIAVLGNSSSKLIQKRRRAYSMVPGEKLSPVARARNSVRSSVSTVCS